MEKPQEAFLAKKGEVKYWLHDNEAFTKLKEYEADSTNSGKSKQGVLKSKKSEQMQAIQSAFPLHDTLINVINDTNALIGIYTFAYFFPEVKCVFHYMWSFLPICCAGGFGFFSQGTCTNRINNLEVAIESCKTAETGGVGNLSQVFSKASEDVAAAKAGAEKLTTLEPSAVTQQDVDLAKEQQLVCRKHEEGLTKTLAKAKVLLEN